MKLFSCVPAESSLSLVGFSLFVMVEQSDDFARQLVDDCYDIERQMGSLSSYFDYAAFSRDLFMTDYSMGEHGHVFRVI